MEREVNKAIITVVGEDRKGVISTISTALAERNINILDISQTIIDGYFSMIMVVDIRDCSANLADLSNDLIAIGKNIGMVVTCQHEDLFRYMHRI